MSKLGIETEHTVVLHGAMAEVQARLRAALAQCDIGTPGRA